MEDDRDTTNARLRESLLTVEHELTLARIGLVQAAKAIEKIVNGATRADADPELSEFLAALNHAENRQHGTGER